MEIAIEYNDGFNEIVFSFVNNINTREGGTHISGFRGAFTRTLNDYLKKSKHAKKMDESLSVATTCGRDSPPSSPSK
jgi:DNA gyrase subunit B